MGAGTGANTTNLEIGIFVKVYEVGVSLGEAGKGSSSMELCLELVDVVFSKFKEVVGAADG